MEDGGGCCSRRTGHSLVVTATANNPDHLESESNGVSKADVNAEFMPVDFMAFHADSACCLLQTRLNLSACGILSQGRWSTYPPRSSLPLSWPWEVIKICVASDCAYTIRLHVRASIHTYMMYDRLAIQPGRHLVVCSYLVNYILSIHDSRELEAPNRNQYRRQNTNLPVRMALNSEVHI
jgi:hypothetical protein